MENKLLFSIFLIIIVGIGFYFLMKMIIDKKNKEKLTECYLKECNYDNDLTICMSINSPEEQLKCRQDLKIQIDNCENKCKDKMK
jgi:hypothetical protein